MYGHAIVDVSLKAPGKVPGDCSSEQIDALADIADRCGHSEIRVTREQNLALPHVKLDDIASVHAALRAVGCTTPNTRLAGDIIACPGRDTGALADASAIPLAPTVAGRFADTSSAERIGALRLRIPGRINTGGHHPFAPSDGPTSDAPTPDGWARSAFRFRHVYQPRASGFDAGRSPCN